MKYSHIHKWGPKVIGQLASRLFLIRHVYSIASQVQVQGNFQCLVLILGFGSPLETVIAVLQHEENLKSRYGAEK